MSRLALVAAAGGSGAVARHLITLAVDSGGRRRRLGLPLGILAVNLIGSFALGLLVGLRADGEVSTTTLTVLGTGLCGALTTWSTFVVEVRSMVGAGRRRAASAYVVISLALGLAAAVAGRLLATL